MHVPTDRLRIHVAADQIINQYNFKKHTQHRIYGHIQACDATKPGCLMLVAFLGDLSKFATQAFPSEVLTKRIMSLAVYFRRGIPVSRGLTSSDLGSQGGAVIIGDLIFSFASQHCHEKEMLDEAITLMIAVKAGLLQRRQVYSLRCTPGEKQFNPELRRLMHTITWTN
jgi:hypothetical protein